MGFGVTIQDIIKDMKAKYESPVNKIKRDAKDYGHMAPIKPLTNNAAIGAKTLVFKTEVGSASGGTPYSVLVQFNGIDYTQDPPKGDKSYVMTKIVDKEEASGFAIWYYKKPSIANTPAAVKCSCSDFRFRWEKYLFDHKALIGNWRKYDRVPGSTRPSVNPNQALGVCKHLYSVIESLKNSGFIDP